MSLDLKLQRIWYSRSLWSLLLLPLSWIFLLCVVLRRAAYKHGVLRSVQVQCPVIVVGNITVGGTGKTPVVIWLTTQLQQRGLRCAVITRGFGGCATLWPQMVTACSDPHWVGDEAVLLAQRTGAMVVAAPDRVAAARCAIAQGAEVLISDDGLQHYRLWRDVEIAVVDAARLLGNGRMLPAGPLREPMQRLQSVDIIWHNHRTAATQTVQSTRPFAVNSQIKILGVRAIKSGVQRALSDFVGSAVHVVSGIGHPQAFHMLLRSQGLSFDTRVLPDHAVITQRDIEFSDSLPVLMTEKDAVKCQHYVDDRHWAVSIDLELSKQDANQVLHVIMHHLSLRK